MMKDPTKSSLIRTLTSKLCLNLLTEERKEPRLLRYWAFLIVAAVEGINKIVTGNLTILSEQELIDCESVTQLTTMAAPENENGDSNNKKRCLMDYAFEYIFKNGGVRKEEDYPYSMEEGTY
ncbi:hypothetical protein DY000_02036298 [Brassica cretica]|uniref:Peptidase C1A papain C-terminal domain-containing protein n=1 Tax=Brassica cretica TaxID=69181 RepID=A0ABQ7BDB2_BRACR|nr:hypothetical protein DY000_02036298 [Brassica cretica]